MKHEGKQIRTASYYEREWILPGMVTVGDAEHMLHVTGFREGARAGKECFLKPDGLFTYGRAANRYPFGGEAWGWIGAYGALSTRSLVPPTGIWHRNSRARKASPRLRE